MDYYSMLNKKETSYQVMNTWRNLQCMPLRGRSQCEKATYGMIPSNDLREKVKTMETIRRPRVSGAGGREEQAEHGSCLGQR